MFWNRKKYTNYATPTQYIDPIVQLLMDVEAQQANRLRYALEAALNKKGYPATIAMLEEMVSATSATR